MGKNLKGKEYGKGICQREDGLYDARFVTKRGKRMEDYFDTLPEARNWLEEARNQNKHGKPITLPDMAVDEWFEFWQAELLQGLSPNTKRNYKDRYEHNIKPVRAVDDIHFLTVEEQQKFLEAAKSTHNFCQYALALDTGLGTGEMIGLTWDAIDWEKRTSPPTRPCVSTWPELLAGFV